MPCVKTDQLKPGMILTVRVKNSDDVVLLPSGCVLRERHIELLAGWGIPEVEVQVDECAADAPAGALESH